GVLADMIQPVEEDANLVRKETDDVSLKCSYQSTSSNILLYWYRQRSDKAPEYLLYKGAKAYSSSQSSPTDTRLQSKTDDTSTELIITGLKLTDSALYYCALRVTQ
uniref:Ig-like domain-containing protein n=1 Tax=Astyanax mexicanus TaxID=7994 RepID=A0A8B9J878_ASTMX